MVDRAASTSIAALLRSMAQSASLCSRTIVVSLPTAEVLTIPNNRNSQCVAPERLRIELDLSGSDAWSLVEDGTVVHWRMGSESLRSVADVFAGQVLRLHGGQRASIVVLGRAYPVTA